MPELLHYIHCPFCVRVRMVLGFLNINYKSSVIPYSDENTPLKISGKKMLPIWVDQNTITNESLDIIKEVDQEGRFNQEIKVNDLISNLGSPIHSLVMPYWIWTPEFSEEDRKYFQQKKELKRGSFEKLLRNRDTFESDLAPLLSSLEQKLDPFYQSKTLTINDILIASHLWGLYLLPEFQFTISLDQYLKTIKKECRFDYLMNTRS